MSKKDFMPNKKDSRDKDFITFEPITGNENVVKAISFNDGKKNEVLVYVISEEQFDELIPFKEKQNYTINI